MLQKESFIHSGDNSKWLILKIFHIYRNGFKKQGHVSFITFSSIRKRKKSNIPKKNQKKKKRSKRLKKTFACLITSISNSRYNDGQQIKMNTNLAASFTRRIIKSKLKIKTPCFFNVKRTKYISRAKLIL